MTTNSGASKPRKDITRTLSIAGLSSGALLLNLAFSILTAREMTTAGRGSVALAITIGTTTSLVCSLGVNVSARYYLPQRGHLVTVGDYLGLGLVLLVVQTLIALGISILLLQRAASGGATAVALATWYSAASFLSYLLLDALNAFGRLQSSQAVSVAGSLVQLVAVIVVASGGQLSVTRALLALCTGPVLQVLGCVVVLNVAGEMHAPRLRRTSSAQLIRKGMPALGMNAGQSLTFRLDRYVVAGVLGNAQLGIYSVAVAGSEVLRVIPLAWSQIQFYRVAAGDVDPRTLAKHRRVLLLGLIPLLVVWGLSAHWIAVTVVGPVYGAAATSWRILLIGELGAMVYQIDSRILSARGRTRAAGLAGALGLAVVVPLDLLMIPFFGLTGAAISSAVAYLAMGLAAALASKESVSSGKHR